MPNLEFRLRDFKSVAVHTPVLGGMSLNGEETMLCP